MLNPPVSESDLKRIVFSVGYSLPEDYIHFLRRHNGGEGFIGDHYVILWGAEELVPFNGEYQVEQYAPGIFLFGSNAGGEGYGFDTEEASPPVVRVPFIGMDRRYAEPIANNFTELGADAMTVAPGGPIGMEVFEIKPVILGGDPVDPKNKALLTRQQHFEAVRYWNRFIADLRKQQAR